MTGVQTCALPIYLLETPEAEETAGMISNLTDSKNLINDSFSRHLPGFNWLSKASEKLYQTIEAVADRGLGGLTSPGGKEIYFNNLGKKIKPEDFEKSARGFIARGGLENNSTDPLKTTMKAFEPTGAPEFNVNVFDELMVCPVTTKLPLTCKLPIYAFALAAKIWPLA